MSNEHNDAGTEQEYEIFISYARVDNKPEKPDAPEGWVIALRDQIVADHRAFSTAPLRIFLDTDDIGDMDDWWQKILKALRHSKILLVCLSPNYFASKYCRKEWEEYVQRQVHQRIGQDSIATVYFVDVPGTSEQENARRLEMLCRGNFTDIRPWFPEGPVALRREVVRSRMANLGVSLWQRIKRARQALAAPGNLRQGNPYFLGRNEELRQLHEKLALGAVGCVTALHGLGGQGKTEVAVGYAHAFAHEYGAGLWLLRAEGKKELLPLIGELAFDPKLEFQPTDAQKNDPVLLGRAVIAELQRRSEAVRKDEPGAGSAALLILDNVSEPALLSAAQLATLPRSDALRIIVTTRLGRDQMPGSPKALAFVPVDSLDEKDALALMRDHQPARDAAGLFPDFASPAEESAARDILRELGCFTLAVEQVAVHLGLHPEITPSKFLLALRARPQSTMKGVGARDDVQAKLINRHPQLSLVLDATLTTLPQSCLTALKFAALLSPDIVPWDWLKALCVPLHPELEPDEHALTDPWLDVRRRLEGSRFLTEGDNAEIARIHRLVAAQVRESVPPEFVARVQDLVARRARDLAPRHSHPEAWTLDALLACLPLFISDDKTEGSLPAAASYFAERLKDYRGLAAAWNIMNSAHDPIRRRCETHPDDVESRFNLSRVLCRMGDVELERGQLDVANGRFLESLEIARRVAATDPQSVARQNRLFPSLSRLSDVCMAKGCLTEALAYSIECRDTAERMNKLDPGNTDWLWDLSWSHDRIGEVLCDQGDLAGAMNAYSEAMGIRTRLAASDPFHAGWQRDLSVSHDRIGDVLMAQGDLAGAHTAYRESLAIRERLAASDPSHAGWQRNLFVSYWRMADISEKTGQGNAKEWWRKAYDQLSGMKQRGIMLPKDEQHLALLRRKV